MEIDLLGVKTYLLGLGVGFALSILTSWVYVTVVPTTVTKPGWDHSERIQAQLDIVEDEIKRRAAGEQFPEPKSFWKKPQPWTGPIAPY